MGQHHYRHKTQNRSRPISHKPIYNRTKPNNFRDFGPILPKPIIIQETHFTKKHKLKYFDVNVNVKYKMEADPFHKNQFFTEQTPKQFQGFETQFGVKISRE